MRVSRREKKKLAQASIDGASTEITLKKFNKIISCQKGRKELRRMEEKQKWKNEKERKFRRSSSKKLARIGEMESVLLKNFKRNRKYKRRSYINREKNHTHKI